MECVRLRVKDEDGYDIRTVPALLGHANLNPTMIYIHVLNRGVNAVHSLPDRQVNWKDYILYGQGITAGVSRRSKEFQEPLLLEAG